MKRSELAFAKMHGLGNDFMVVDLVSQSLNLDPVQIRCWSDRHTGVGFDQLLVIAPPENPEADFRYQIFNADGSEAEQCGNGARCVARYVRDAGLSVKPVLRFQTSNGQIETRVLDNDLVEVDMGPPVLELDRIPCDPSEAGPPVSVGQTSGYPLTAGNGESWDVVPVSMGNPHGVIFVDDITTAPVQETGAALTTHPFFPEHANIGFCQVVDDNFIRLRVFERGVGETRACGTGACAAAVAGMLAGRLDRKVKVSLPGGKVRVRWQGQETPVRMTGPATLVYEGNISITSPRRKS